MSFSASLSTKVRIEKYHQNWLFHSPTTPLEQTSSVITEVNNDIFSPQPCHVQASFPELSSILSEENSVYDRSPLMATPLYGKSVFRFVPSRSVMLMGQSGIRKIAGEYIL
ncbi:hypothetical protein CEXT_527061 [Caerostris extrusa]|uniref:Uncharacterized protein n=1 Tax=Caerostris extrusa TaxID=172846 RepID=A0AAV4XIS5_CAEEX|nr:hypothetical protein CEXT_527061 [Caerostris extrusa]